MKITLKKYHLKNYPSIQNLTAQYNFAREEKLFVAALS